MRQTVFFPSLKSPKNMNAWDWKRILIPKTGHRHAEQKTVSVAAGLVCYIYKKISAAAFRLYQKIWCRYQVDRLISARLDLTLSQQHIARQGSVLAYDLVTTPRSTDTKTVVAKTMSVTLPSLTQSVPQQKAVKTRLYREILNVVVYGWHQLGLGRRGLSRSCWHDTEQTKVV